MALTDQEVQLLRDVMHEVRISLMDIRSEKLDQLEDAAADQDVILAVRLATESKLLYQVSIDHFDDGWLDERLEHIYGVPIPDNQQGEDVD